MTPLTVDRRDLQPLLDGATAEGIHAVYSCDIFARLRGATHEERRAALRAVLSAAPDRDACRVTVALTAAGLARLGVAQGLVGAMNGAFVTGAHRRASLLGDGAEEWDRRPGPGDDTHDLMLLAESSSIIEGETITSGLDDALTDTLVVPTFLPADRRERFGFRDGVSNPVLAGMGAQVPPGNGVRVPGGWRALAAGEIICGYPDENGQLPGPTSTHDLTRNGSYLVWHKLQQHPDRFQRLVEAIHAPGPRSEHPPGTPHLGTETHPWCPSCAALIIGRHQDGRPLQRTAIGQNGFDYNEPSTAPQLRPSRNSHIRRANPRRTDGFEPGTVDRHRMLRRSVRWEERTDGRVLREGLVFRCLQADIERSFEFVQRSWMNGGDAFKQGRCRDALVGVSAKVEGDPLDADRNVLWLKARHPMPESLTTPLGTCYAFVPGRRVLQLLASPTHPWLEPVGIP